MSHIVRKTDWGEFDIDVNKARVFFQQRWKYSWQVKAAAPALAAWTLKEKRAFHHQVDQQIWASWSNKVTLRVSGTSDLAKKLKSKRLPIDLDVRWVLKDEHWNVTVWKNPSTDMPHNSVQWTARTIELHTSKMKPYEACTDATPKVCTVGFKSVPHEFGHAIGNTSVLGRGDEYASDSPHLADTDSILNIGRQLRERHFKTMLEEMNKMVPNTTFEVDRIA